MSSDAREGEVGKEKINCDVCCSTYGKLTTIVFEQKLKHPATVRKNVESNMNSF